MRIYEYGKDPLPNSGCALAIGVFDGVHIAHRTLIMRAKEEAASDMLPVGVFTFSPKSGIKAGSACIYTLEKRLSVIESLGVDFCVVASFEDIRGMSAENFCRDILFNALAARICVVGYNFHFGKGASADADFLKATMTGYGAKTLICPEECLDGESISSTAIRRYLEAGNIARATAMLGDRYSIEGCVQHGRGIGGKRLSAPTANLPLPENTLVPRLGVYATTAEIDGAIYSAATDLGVCPTYGEMLPHAEAYIIGYSGNLYGKKIKLSFLAFLREERHFDNEESLKKQIKIDIDRTIEEFKRQNEQ